ncbi:hypothetical protein SAMN02745218_01542 [Desulfofundulus australicus DSM 11792]|uniref:Homeodomain-like domain-containing protein n=1 Tax=Desulfofundulus australicus DSM 11792 TaxID=1121425 RepID=A0A1M4Z8R2_9FIRM|nr:hypothetical protein [Desulfofundulus australicus]SHF14404.1 hypothetical protein SAMN02745218_01542 [Desulfofundulus australicus DSM 11792]
MRGEEIDVKSISRKYRTNVSRLIRAWKKGLSDMEIASTTGIDPATLNRIRSDIEMAHRRLRLARRKDLSHLLYL